MCLAIPMKIIEIDGFNARCEARGVERDVSLFIMQDEAVAAGDFVMVHVGYAIQKVTPQEARSTWELFDQVDQLSGENHV
ncbi:MAG TPA: HypC/HybG/HupF family hydrogenase formation chaperone [Gammaproteobacteria bacterium]|nr:HypC/HybG/HupF family hydrogenase formation chaperone [Gammaproteobacteria bacterium]